MANDPIVPDLNKLVSKEKLRAQLHQSGLEMISKCGVQFAFRYLQGLKRKPNAFLICGTATDRAVGTDLDHKIDTGELEQESVLLDVARDAVEKYPEKESIELDEDEAGKSVNDVLGETKDKAVRLVKVHHAEVAPAIRPHATNKKFSINIDNFLRTRARELRERAEHVSRPLARVLDLQARYLNVAARNGLDFVGEFDIVEKFADSTADNGDPVVEGAEATTASEVSVIRDTKTSRKTPSQDVAETSHQLDAYSVAHHVLYGKVPDAVKLDYLVDLKSGVKATTLTSHRDEDDVQKYLNRLVAGVVQIQSGNFVPASNNAWWCDEKWCSFFNMCDYVKHRTTSVPQLVQIKGANTGDAA